MKLSGLSKRCRLISVLSAGRLLLLLLLNLDAHDRDEQTPLTLFLSLVIVPRLLLLISKIPLLCRGKMWHSFSAMNEKKKRTIIFENI